MPLHASIDILMTRTVTTDSTIHWVKIEKGNQATDWTPAPEDIDSGIKQSQEAANNAQNAANNAQIKQMKMRIEFLSVNL